jgi:phosphohistidine phosphatase
MKEPLRVYFVRHGKAEKDSPGGDAARRLTPEGRARFYALAGSLAEKLDLARIVTSPAARARQTAEILAAATGAPVVENHDLAPGCSTARDLLAMARGEGAGVALVGHNPEMAEAVSLAAGQGEKLQPGAVAAVDLSKARSALAWIEAPEKE